MGIVVPKRHAKRSVTRQLLKRQIRAAFAERPGMPPGLWVVRLRSPFDRQKFPSAASDALRQAARAELAQLLDRALKPQPPKSGAQA
ncbi:Ribonuclease P protein component [Roseateles saccharophilus]|uniref:Ribonuclease P protein component n=1 Tax=Roseateles saccharophilus TaxID=304 RepID=A0A4R3UJW6_ROSSA|nr:ribonuclease P protein component [Roseateles saccharophilus]